MTSIPWHTLRSLQDWTDVLERLLTAAEEAVLSDDAVARIHLQEQLLEFVKQSPATCRGLDDIATQASSDLFRAQLDSALRSLAERRQELAAARRLIDAAAEEARQDARSLQFRVVIDLLDRAADSLHALKRLESAINTPDRDLLDRVASVLDAIEALRAIAAKRVPGSVAPPRRKLRRPQTRRK